MRNHFDRAGKPIELMEWAKLHSDRDYIHIGLFEDERLTISTVWLGLDIDWPGSLPEIFETMIFVRPGADIAPGFDQAQWRWRTEEEAKEGHDVVVRCYHEGLEPDKPLQAVKEKHSPIQ